MVCSSYSKLQGTSVTQGHLQESYVRGILQTTWTLKKMIFQSVTLAAGKQKSREVGLGNLGGGVPPGSPNPDPISDQKNVIFHTRFQTWPLKSIPILRPGL